MAAPVMAAMPSAGNLIASASLAASSNFGALVDASAQFEAQVDISDTTGGTAAATSGVSISAYHVFAQTTTTGTTTNNGTALSAAGTSVTVASATGIHVGQQIAIENEIVTVSAISTNTLTISALKRSHSNGVAVYLITQTPPTTGPTLGQNLTAANTTYSAALFLQTGTWYVSLTNTDATNAVTIEGTSRAITGVA